MMASLMADSPPTDAAADACPPRTIARRDALRLGLAGGLSALAAAWLPGCVGSVPAYYAAEPGGRAGAAGTATRDADAPVTRPLLAPPIATTPAPLPPLPAAPAAATGSMRVTPRSAWTREGPGGNVQAMNGVRRITVHHSAMVMSGTAAASTAQMLTAIREGHRQRGWADIGYHFAVDRAGRVLACRDLRDQVRTWPSTTSTTWASACWATSTGSSPRPRS